MKRREGRKRKCDEGEETDETCGARRGCVRAGRSGDGAGGKIKEEREERRWRGEGGLRESKSISWRTTQGVDTTTGLLE